MVAWCGIDETAVYNEAVAEGIAGLAKTYDALTTSQEHRLVSPYNNGAIQQTDSGQQ